MTALEVQVTSIITNGSSALRITARAEKSAYWGTAGWHGVGIGLEPFGGDRGMTRFVPDHLLSGWYHVPFEWRPCVGGAVEERYVWSSNWRWLQREVRVIKPVPVDCQAEHGVGHPDCPKCWRWSERNPNAVPRP